jgi:pimeloyl-ACP methyl ester carboxylesterase
MRYARNYLAELPQLAELLPGIDLPVTIINGRHDRVVPPSNAAFLDERLPNGRVVLLDHGHFVWRRRRRNTPERSSTPSVAKG